MTTVEELIAEETFPEVQPHAIEAYNEKKEAEEKTAVSEDKEVKLKKDGTPAKKRGRKPKSEINDPRASKNKEEPAQLADIIDSTNAARTVSGILEGMQITLISEEFTYNDHERNQNVEAWKAAMDHYGGVKMHPIAELAASHASIILARATKPKSETQTKFGMIKGYFSLKLAKLKGKLKPKVSIDPIELAEEIEPDA
jgi:hypothetical protein